MAGELAPQSWGIPVVADAASRDAAFPLATRTQDQRVFRKDGGTMERWSGSAWVVDFGNAVVSGEVGVLNAQYPVGDLRRYGAVGDGVADDSTALANALSSLSAIGGGTVVCPLNHRIASQITVPNDGAATPKQVPIRITGIAPGNTIGSPTTVLGSAGILDLRYNGTVAKFVTLGLGTLEVDHLNIIDGGTSSLPFILTTNTTLKVHHNRFEGNPSKSGTSCDQDAIVLGGTLTTVGNTTNSPFQGYGTDIHDNGFHRIRRGVYGRTFCNDVDVRGNWFLHTCGTNLVGTLGAAIEFVGGATDYDSGNRVIGNTVEMGAYPYMVRLQKCVHTTIAHNGGFDPTATTLGYVRCEADAQYNLIVPGYASDVQPYLSDASSPTTQTVLTSHQAMQSVLPGGLKVGPFAGSAFALYVSDALLTDTAGNTWQEQTVTGAQPQRRLDYTPSGGAVEAVARWQRASATDKRLYMEGSTDNRVEAVTAAANLRAYAGVGGTFFFGDSTNNWNLTNGILGTSLAAGAQLFGLTGKINAVTGARGGSEAARTWLAAAATAGLITNNSTAGNTAIAYSASMTIDASTTDVATITATTNVAFAINAPLNPQPNMKLRVRIRNTSGGALGVATWNAVFKMGAAWTQPATGFSRTIDFDYDGTNWVESNRSAADVPN